MELDMWTTCGECKKGTKEKHVFSSLDYLISTYYRAYYSTYKLLFFPCRLLNSDKILISKHEYWNLIRSGVINWYRARLKHAIYI